MIAVWRYWLEFARMRRPALTVFGRALRWIARNILAAGPNLGQCDSITAKLTSFESATIMEIKSAMVQTSEKINIRGSLYEQLLSANLIIVILVSGSVGPLAGYLLGGIVTNHLYLSIISAVLAVMASASIHRILNGDLSMNDKPGTAKLPMPAVVTINSFVASIIAGLAGYQLTLLIAPASPVFTGLISGVLGGVLMSLLMISYRTALNSRQ